MRKIIITLTLITLVFFAFTGMAYSQVLKDVPFENVNPTYEPDVLGKAFINFNPPDSSFFDVKSPGVIVNASFWGLNPECKYQLRSYFEFNEITFTPNKSGNAKVHLNIVNVFEAQKLYLQNVTRGYTILEATPSLPGS